MGDDVDDSVEHVHGQIAPVLEEATHGSIDLLPARIMSVEPAQQAAAGQRWIDPPAVENEVQESPRSGRRHCRVHGRGAYEALLDDIAERRQTEPGQGLEKEIANEGLQL